MTLERKIEIAMSSIGLRAEIVTVRIRDIPNTGRRKVVNFQCRGMKPGDFKRAKLALDGPFILINSAEAQDGTSAAFEARASK